MNWNNIIKFGIILFIYTFLNNLNVYTQNTPNNSKLGNEGNKNQTNDIDSNSKKNILTTITFSSTPDNFIYINNQYQYNPKAVASDNSSVKYELISGPDNMIYNDNNESITWYPDNIGNTYQIVLKAYLPKNPNTFTYQTWILTVVSCSEMSAIIGTVISNDGNAVSDGMVVAYFKYQKTDINYITFSATISNGKFYLPVDKGYSALYFVCPNYESEWYSDTYSYSTANQIKTTCNDTIKISAQLKALSSSGNVIFSSTPDSQCTINNTYHYKPKTIGTTDCKISYKLIQSPEGLTIDTTSGEINWTPDTKGEYYIKLNAYCINNSSVYAEQEWTIWVTNCSIPAVLKGKVTDEAGSLIGNGIVQVYDGNSQDTSFLASYNITKGIFNISLDESIYFLKFSANDYDSAWYNNAVNFQDATPIKVNCNDNLNINMKLTKSVPTNTYSISGKVFKASDQTLVPFAELQFIAKNKKLNQISIFYAWANNGVYSISLTDEYTYQIFCSISSDSVNYKYKNLVPQFYNNTSDASTAMILDLTANKTDVNFYLTSTDDSKYITGRVINDNNLPLEYAYIVAYSINYNNTSTYNSYKVGSAITNSAGEFQIGHLSSDDYILLIIPNDENYFAGYYNESKNIVTQWQNATLLHTSTESTISSLNIILPKTDLPAGNSRITAKVRNKYTSNGVKDSIPGAVIFIAKKNSNTFFGGSISDYKGSINLDNLEKGTYYILANKVGYYDFDSLYIIQSDIDTTNTTIEMEKIIMTSVNETNNYDANVIIFPNPASDNITIIFNGLGGYASMRIFNIYGNEIHNSTINTETGLNSLTYPTQDIPSGIYYISIENGRNRITLQASIVH